MFVWSRAGVCLKWVGLCSSSSGCSVPARNMRWPEGVFHRSFRKDEARGLARALRFLESRSLVAEESYAAMKAEADRSGPLGRRCMDGRS